MRTTRPRTNGIRKEKANKLASCQRTQRKLPTAPVKTAYLDFNKEVTQNGYLGTQQYDELVNLFKCLAPPWQQQT